jgi:hypothetical protein
VSGAVLASDARNVPSVARGGRALVVLGAAAILVLTGAPPAAASPAGPVTRCALSDPRLDEVSGMAVTPAGPAVVNDSGNATVVYTLAPDCSVASVRSVGVSGRDVEDLARTADGTLWLADIGDNDRRRTSIALIRLPVRGPASVRRLTYPDGPHDAETLLLPGDGRPVIITKDLGGRSGIYTTDVPPTEAATTPLRHVGQFVVPLSATEGGPVGPFGRGLVTGGALSTDGGVAAVRTYTDAWLYRVDGDAASADAVVAALRTTPVDVPLAGEPQGEAVAFTADGTLLSAGESTSPRSGGGTASLRAVPGATALAPAPGAASTAPTASSAADAATTPGTAGATTGRVAGVLGAVLGAAVLLGALFWMAWARVGRRRPRGRR